MTNIRRTPLRKRSGRSRLLAGALLLASAAGVAAPTGAQARGVAPSTVTTSDGGRYVYFRTSTGQLGAWSIPASGGVNSLTWGLADSVRGDVSAVRVANGDRYVYFRRPSGQLGVWRHFADGVNWNESDVGLADTVVGSPSAVVAANGDRYVYFRRPNGQLGVWRFFADGVNWNESSVGNAGTVVGDPAAVVAPNGDRYVYFRTPNGQLGTWKFFADNVNLNYTASGTAGQVAGNPKPAVTATGNRYISFRTASGQLGLWWFAPDGVNWNYTTWGTTGNLLDDPAPAFTPNGEYYAYYRRANGQLGVHKFPVSGPPTDDGAGYSGLVAGSPSIVVGSDGARFVYYTRTNGQLGAWWFGPTSGWNSAELGAIGSLPAVDDQYTTSWDLGGPNAKVDSPAEADNVITAIRAASSDAAANALRVGLTPSDLTYVTARIEATALSSRTYGGANWKVDTAAEADAFIAGFRGASSDPNAGALYFGLAETDRAYTDERMRVSIPNDSLIYDVTDAQLWYIGEGDRDRVAPQYGPGLVAELGAAPRVSRAVVDSFAFGEDWSDASIEDPNLAETQDEADSGLSLAWDAEWEEGTELYAEYAQQSVAPLVAVGLCLRFCPQAARTANVVGKLKKVSSASKIPARTIPAARNWAPNPTQLAQTFKNARGSNSGRTLGRNIEKRAKDKPGDAERRAARQRKNGFHAHHIVATGDRRAAFGRAVLQNCGTGPNDPANGVWLNDAQHRGLHTNAYFRNVNEALRPMWKVCDSSKSGSDNKLAMTLALKGIAFALQARQFPH